MKTLEKFLKLHNILILFAIILLTVTFVGCNDSNDDDYSRNNKALLINDVTLVADCIGVTSDVATVMVKKRGFAENTKADNSNKRSFNKTENNITKNLTIYIDKKDIQSKIDNVCMSVNNDNSDTLKNIFKSWLKELRISLDFSLVAREYYSFKVGDTYKHYYNIDSVLVNIDSIFVNDCNIASVEIIDKNANEYSISLLLNTSPYVYLQVINQRVNDTDTDTIPQLSKLVGMNDDILIMKVDFQTFNYEGYTTVCVKDKITMGDTIPFYAEYVPPMDFGYIKLYYKDIQNPLFYGDIVWNGCGKLYYPNKFYFGKTINTNLPFPTENNIDFISDNGSYTRIYNDKNLQKIWQTISCREEFLKFYKNSSKKVAVYFYQPSVGVGNPYDWDYFVFIEQK